jgi:hypothetical protein
MIEVAKGSIERTRQAAEAVRLAAAAIGTIYAAVLALAFSVAKPLPPRGLIPAVFLGLAIFFATAFVAWLPRTVAESNQKWPIPTGDLGPDQRANTEMFIRWAKEPSIKRFHVLRGGVLALAFGIAYLPVPFMAIGSSSAAEPSEVSLTAFPSPPTVTETTPVGAIELEKILYTAQVAEVSEVRKQQLATTPGEAADSLAFWLIYGSAALALIVTLAVGLRLPWRRGEDKQALIRGMAD